MSLSLYRRYIDTATYWPKVANFAYPLLFSAFLWGDSFESMEKLYGSWN